jgi:hypothetical protein
MYTVLGNVPEQVPDHIPVPLGHKVVGTAYVWATLCYNMVDGCSVTGILQRNLVNDTPVKWYSKRQCVTEVTTNGSEFVDSNAFTNRIPYSNVYRSRILYSDAYKITLNLVLVDTHELRMSDFTLLE